MTPIGIIGGSGLYEIDGFEQTANHSVETPFGSPSDLIVEGTLAGRQVFFLPRHGRGHRLLPTEINHRANIWALRSLDVRFLICVTAVGSLKEEYHPRDIVLPDQYFDRTSRREHGAGQSRGKWGAAYPRRRLVLWTGHGLHRLAAGAYVAWALQWHGPVAAGGHRRSSAAKPATDLQAIGAVGMAR